MSTSKKSASKKPVTKTESSRAMRPTSKQSFIKTAFVNVRLRAKGLLARRPHRSFRRTLRRDYVRALTMPGYWAFTAEVWRMLWSHKRTFLLLAVTYGVLNALLVGLASQDTYSQLSDMLQELAPNVLTDGAGKLGQAGILLASGAFGLFGQMPTDAQRIFAVLLGLMAWLTAVWLLRAFIAGKQPKLRDGLYNSSAPLISSFLVSLVMILQLLPVAFAMIVLSAASAAGFADGGIEAMLVWTVVGLLSLLSVYWLTSSLIALVVVTLPGVYPMQALRTAGDLVIGRRGRILLRFAWGALCAAVAWGIVMVPVILLDMWIKRVWEAVDWVPIVPGMLAVVSALSIVWIAAYVYMVYRKVVDDGSAPA